MSDRELQQAYEVSLDDDSTINLVSLHVVRDPESNTRLAELIEQDVERILDLDPDKRYCLMINLLPLGNDGYASSKARKAYARISSHEQIRKFAIVGGGVFSRTLAGLIIRAAGRGQSVRWLASREEAVEWLRMEPRND
jgi:hypothetical protein